MEREEYRIANLKEEDLLKVKNLEDKLGKTLIVYDSQGVNQRKQINQHNGIR